MKLAYLSSTSLTSLMKLLLVVGSIDEAKGKEKKWCCWELRDGDKNFEKKINKEEEIEGIGNKEGFEESLLGLEY